MKKPAKPSLRRETVATLKPINVNMNVDPDSPEARTVTAIKPDGKVIRPPPTVSPALALKIGTSQGFAKAAAGQYRHRFLLHIDPQNALTAIDSFPLLEFMARMYPTELQPLETVAVRVDPTNGSLSVDKFASGLPKCAPYVDPMRLFPRLYAAIDKIDADALLPEVDLGGVGVIDSVEGQVITVRVPRPAGV